MKAHIEEIVRSIRHHLAHSSPSETQLAAPFLAFGRDGLSEATNLMATLDRWAEDVTITQDVRDYAQEQIAALRNI